MTDSTKDRDIPSTSPKQSEFMPEKPFSANTGRRWKLYELCLKLGELKDWDGKTIVDVGSSYKPSYDKKVTELFPGAKVIAVDPSFIINGKGAYRLEEYDQYQLRNMSQDYDPDTERRIGVVQELPIEDHSVDQVWSLMAVPLHLPLNHQGRMWAEMLRVLKPGGEVRLAPYAGRQDTFFAKLLQHYGYQVEMYTLDHGDKHLPQNGVILKVPEMSPEDVHALYESFKQYLIGANIYATGKDWDTDYFRQSYDEPETKIESPLPKPEPPTSV